MFDGAAVSGAAPLVSASTDSVAEVQVAPEVAGVRNTEVSRASSEARGQAAALAGLTAGSADAAHDARTADVAVVDADAVPANLEGLLAALGGLAQAGDDVDLSATITASAPTGASWVFVDARVSDSASLLAQVDPAARLVYLDPDLDGVEQIAEVLAEARDSSAIHLLSHGTAGSLQLGTATLDLDSITGRYAEALGQIGAALGRGADLLIYGCDFAAGEVGVRTSLALTDATGADVAASVDDTGSATLGGNWVLEHRTGSIEAQMIAASDYGLLLAPAVSRPYIDLDGHSATIDYIVSWQHDGNTTEASWLWEFVDSADAETAGPGLTLSFPSTTTLGVDGADADSYENAVAAGDYLHYRFQTGADVPLGAVISEVYFGHNLIGDASYRVAIELSTDGFLTAEVLARDHLVEPPSSPGGTQLDLPDVALLPNTTYELRAYLYDRVGTLIEWDDFRPLHALDPTGSAVTQVQNASPVGLVTSQAVIEQLGSPPLQAAVVTLTSPQAGDILLVDGSTAASGTLASGIQWTRSDALVSFAGTASQADYLQALATVEFQALGSAYSSALRQVSVVVDDGQAQSDPAWVNITVDPHNEAPVNTLPGSFAVAEGGQLSLTGLAVSDSDAGTGVISITLTVDQGSLTAAAATGVTVTGAGTSAI